MITITRTCPYCGDQMDVKIDQKFKYLNTMVYLKCSHCGSASPRTVLKDWMINPNEVCSGLNSEWEDEQLDVVESEEDEE